MAKQDVELQFKLIDGVTKSLTAIQQGVSGLGASLVKVNAAAELTGKAFGAIGSVAGAFGDAIVGAASVEDALTRVNTITAATVEEQKALQEAVRGAVDGTRFSAEEAAGALVLLAEDGFSAADAVAQLNTVLQFAQANAQTAAQAAAGLGAVLDTYGEGPQVIGQLADKLTAVAVAAGTSTKALQEGLAGVGNAADQAGLSLDETIGYLGLLASRGIEGGAAVGNFNKIIRELSDPASKAGEALAALGLQGADFSTVMKRLGNDGVAAEQVLSALGKKPREALRVLLTEGGGDLGKFGQVLDEATGKTKAASDALNDTFAGALARISNQLAQTRNDLLTPILGPLADEIERVSKSLSEFAQTEQFDLIVSQFASFATKAIQYVGDLVSSFDFKKAVEAVQAFATNTVELFNNVERALNTVANAVNATAKTISDAYNDLAALAARVSAVYRDFRDGTTDALNVAGDGVQRLGEQSDKLNLRIERLGKGLKGTKEGAKELAKATDDAGKAADTAGASLESLGASAQQAASDLATTEKNVAAVEEELRRVQGAGGAAQQGMQSVVAGSNLASLSLSTLEKKLSDVREALSRAVPGSAEFNRLAQEARALEEQIRQTKDAIDAAAGSNERLAGSADRAAGSLRNQASAASQAGAAAGNLAQGNSQVSQSFGNIANQSSSTAIGLGNMTEAYLQQTLAAAGTAKSARDYMNALNAGFARYEDDERRIQQRIETLERMSAVEDEGLQRQRLYETQYGTTSRSLQRLIELEEQQNQTRSRGNEISARGLDLERQRQSVAQAGALNYTQAGAQSEAPTPVAGRGGPAGVASRSAPIQITINQNGANAETIREIAPLIERELLRRGFLGR